MNNAESTLLGYLFISSLVYVLLTAWAVRWGVSAALNARDRNKQEQDQRRGIAPPRSDAR
jgi:hypothetical protein